MLVGIILALAAYFSHLNSYVEFEYLYLSNELSIDRILAKSKRKRMAAFNLQRMEVLAPLTRIIWIPTGIKDARYMIMLQGRMTAGLMC